MKRRLMVVLGALAAVALRVPGAASAAVFNVTTTADEYGEGPGAPVRSARRFEAANTDGSFGGCSAADANADLIHLPAPTYVLTRDGVDDTNVNGDLDVLTEPLSLLGQAPSGPTTIDGDADDADATDDRVIHVHPSVADFAGEDFGATGLVIRGGAPAGFGGGISIVGPLDGPPPPSGSGEAMTVGLSLITFTANRARAGGGGGAITPRPPSR